MLSQNPKGLLLTVVGCYGDNPGYVSATACYHEINICNVYEKDTVGLCELNTGIVATVASGQTTQLLKMEWLCLYSRLYISCYGKSYP